MTTERGQFDQHWTSERFSKDMDNLCLGDHIFEDDDPRIKLVTDNHGDQMWIVGYTDSIKLVPQHKDGLSEIPSKVLVIRVRDNALLSIHPKCLNT